MFHGKDLRYQMMDDADAPDDPGTWPGIYEQEHVVDPVIMLHRRSYKDIDQPAG